MNITCPRCGFSRELPADRAPSKAVIATCPHCACRFRFVPGTGVTEVISEPQEPACSDEQQGGQPQAADAGHSRPASSAGQSQPPQGGWHGGDDDPLPPGAIVPGSSSPRSGAASGAGSEPDDEPRYTPGAGNTLAFIPAGLAPYPVDMRGRAIGNDGTALAGALQPG